jgi:hypothetical protein
MKRLNDSEWIVSNREVVGIRVLTIAGFLAMTWFIISRAIH